MPSVSGPAAMTSWALAPMPFSARGGAVEMTGQTPISVLRHKHNTNPPPPNLYPSLQVIKAYLLLLGDRLRLYGKKKEKEEP